MNENNFIADAWKKGGEYYKMCKRVKKSGTTMGMTRPGIERVAFHSLWRDGYLGSFSEINKCNTYRFTRNYGIVIVPAEILII